MSLSLYVRPNIMIVLGADNQKPDYDYADGATYALYELGDGKTASAIVSAEGGAVAQSLSISRKACTRHLERQ